MLIELNHVQKQYAGFQLDCSMEVSEGCVTGLIGANGAGKSTTFKAILNLIHPEGGEIRIFGKEYGEMSSDEKAEIGVVLSESGFSGYLEIRQIVDIMTEFYPGFRQKAFKERCKQFSLPLNKKIREFSTGMKAKLKVLLAMSYGARLLILDEPTAGLDVVARDEILELLREYMEQEGRAVLISSHISSDLEGLCDDLYMIEKGKIILHEDTDVLLEQYGLLKVDADTWRNLDKKYILRVKKEHYGYSCLTDEKYYYMENYPKIVIEKGSVDEVISIMVKGEKL